MKADAPDGGAARLGEEEGGTEERGAEKTVTPREPRILPEPAPAHAKYRWRAIQQLHDGKPDDAVHSIDAADAASPHLHGFIDGQEFEGLRDADDRFASVLEAFLGEEYVWFTWEGLRKVALAPAKTEADQPLASGGRSR